MQKIFFGGHMKLLMIMSVLFLTACMTVSEDTDCVEPEKPDDRTGAVNEVIDITLEIYCEDKKKEIRRRKEDNKRPF